MSQPRIHLVAAMTQDRVIGRDGAMPWHLPRDLAHFKAVTLGHPVIMGRLTFESILASLGRPLPGRHNMVISRSQPEVPDGVGVYSSVDEAIDQCKVNGADVVDVIGGGQIYAMTLPMADRLHLTLIDADVAGDTWFPDIDLSQWRVVHTDTQPADDQNAYPMTFVTLDRPSPPAKESLQK